MTPFLRKHTILQSYLKGWYTVVVIYYNFKLKKEQRIDYTKHFVVPYYQMIELLYFLINQKMAQLQLHNSNI